MKKNRIIEKINSCSPLFAFIIMSIICILASIISESWASSMLVLFFSLVFMCASEISSWHKYNVEYKKKKKNLVLSSPFYLSTIFLLFETIIILIANAFGINIFVAEQNLSKLPNILAAFVLIINIGSFFIRDMQIEKRTGEK